MWLPIKIHHHHHRHSKNPDANTPHVLFLRFCAFMCQLINFAETLVQLGSFPLLPRCVPAPLDLCVTDRSPRCSSAQKTACVCTFFPSPPSRSPSLPELDGCNMSEHLHSGGTSGRSASVTWLARRLFDRLRRPSPTNLAALSCWRAMKTSVHGNNRISKAMRTCEPRDQLLPREADIFLTVLPKEAWLELVLFLKPLLTCRRPAQTQLTRLIYH